MQPNRATLRATISTAARALMGHLYYAAIPIVAAICGVILTVNRPPGPRLTGAIQHFTAGLNIAAGSLALLPHLAHRSAILPVLIGGGLGVGAMFFVERVTHGKGPGGLIASAVTDTLIDGLVLGLGFISGRRQGFLLLITVTMEAVFLGVSIATAFDRRVGRLRIIGITSGVSLLLLVGLLIAAPIGGLPQTLQDGFFAFGLVGLLYLVTEGLLVEAHERPETIWGTAMFFIAFLLLLVVDDAMR